MADIEKLIDGLKADLKKNIPIIRYLPEEYRDKLKDYI